MQLHVRMMALFDLLEEEYHHGSFNDLYNSAMFCWVAYNHPKKLLVHVVTTKGGHGILSCVQQDKVKTRTSVHKVWGTVKVAKLEYNPDYLWLVALSVYDTKPVHCLSMVSNNIEWIVKEKPVFNVRTNKTEAMRFLQLNKINKYNYDMGKVDITD